MSLRPILITLFTLLAAQACKAQSLPPLPHSGPVLNWILYNDGVARLKLDWEIDSWDDWHFAEAYNKGEVSDSLVYAIAPRTFWIQNPDNSLRQVKRLDWNMTYNKVHADYELLFEALMLPFDAVGDFILGLYYLEQKRYSEAAISGVAVVIPFASGQLFRNGRYLTKWGDEAIELTPAQIWQLPPGIRGELIESAMVQQFYLKAGFAHLAEVSRWWPIFDVVKEGLIVSVKSTQSTKYFGSLLDNIDELAWLQLKGVSYGDELIKTASMDLYIPEGYVVENLQPVISYAAQRGVSLKIIIFN